MGCQESGENFVRRATHTPLRTLYDVSYTDDGGGIVEILRIWEKSEAMKWLAQFGRRTE